MSNFQAFILGLVQGLAEFLPISSSGHTTLLQMLFGIDEAPEILNVFLHLGTLLVLGLFLIEAVFCIHSVKSVELVNAVTYGGRSACQYPIDIFPRPLRVLFTVVAPFALTLHVPAAYILGKPLYGWPAWTAFVTPLAGAAAFWILYAMFQKAMRFYRSTGS